MQQSPAAEERLPSSIANEAIAREELAGFSFMLWGRLAVLTVFAVWVLLTVPFERSGLYFSLISLFALAGTLPYLIARKGFGGVWAIIALLAIEVTGLSYILILPTPFDIESWTPQMNLRLPGFLYLGVFLVAMALSYSPILVIWTGIASIVAWSAGYFWIANLPETVLLWPLDLVNDGVTSEEFIARYLDPRAVRPNFFINQIAFLTAVTIVLVLGSLLAFLPHWLPITEVIVHERIKPVLNSFPSALRPRILIRLKALGLTRFRSAVFR